MVIGRIHNSLRKHRKMLGYSIKDVAWLLNIRCSNRLSRWEKGKAAPSLKNVIKLGLLYHSFAEQLFHEYRQELKATLLERERQLQEMKHSSEKEHSGK
jgi:transcriptional regulator with XRE-family HTH domain